MSKRVTFNPRLSHAVSAPDIVFEIEHVELDRAGSIDAVGLTVRDTAGVRIASDQRARIASTEQRARFARSIAKLASGDALAIERALLLLLDALPAEVSRERAARAAAGGAAAGRYAVQAGSICEVSSDRDETGEDHVAFRALCNFSATITRDILVDDSAETARHFEVAGSLADGTPLPRARVPAAQFASMRWVVEHWGARASVRAGMGAQDRLREAIQYLSASDVEEHHVYAHVGWRKIDDKLVYMHAAGAIGAVGAVDGVEVELSGAAAHVALPTPPVGSARRDAVAASLDFYRLLPVGVAAAVLGATYLAPLRHFLAGSPPDLTVWMHGPSGSFKSEIAALAAAHFGSGFTRTTLPTFTATANAIERLTFTLKDALCVIDDYHPATDYREANALAAVASRLLRGIGNGSGRARMRADTTLRPELPPRCVPLATAERLPGGYSTAGRMLPVAIERADIDTAALSRVQAQREQFAGAMAGYVHWLAQNADQLERDLLARFSELRDAALGAGSHAREPAQVAYLALGVDMFAQYAVVARALAQTEADTLFATAWSALLNLAEQAGDDLASETPVARFLAMLGDGIASRRGYLESRAGAVPHDAAELGWEAAVLTDDAGNPRTVYHRVAGATLLGYADEDWLYLLPETAYSFVATAARAAGDVFPVELKTLVKRLDEAKLIAIEPTTGRRTPHVRGPGGAKRRMIQLQRAALTPSPPEKGGQGGHRGQSAHLSTLVPRNCPPLSGDGEITGDNFGGQAYSNGAAVPPVPPVPPNFTRRDHSSASNSAPPARASVRAGDLVHPVDSDGNLLSPQPVAVLDDGVLFENELWYALAGTDARYPASRLELADADDVAVEVERFSI